MMTYRTRGMVEAEFTREVVKFEKEHLGRGPVDAHTYFLNDMVLVRLHGILTPAEQKLVENLAGRDLVKEMRHRLFESSRPLLEYIVRNVLGCGLVSLYTDMSTKLNERIVVLVVDANLDEKFPQKEKR